MLNWLKNLNFWGALREAREALETANAILAEQRAYIDRLHAALDDIAALETPTSSGTVKKIARIVREVR